MINVKANELRIGNFVKCSRVQTDVFCVIVGFFKETFDGQVFIKYPYKNMHDLPDENEVCEPIRTIFPIPLTPEILEKCGFVQLDTEMSGCRVWDIPNTHWRVAMSYRDETCFKLWHRQVSPPTWRLAEFESLHQLQNLYFALTGTELNGTL